MIRALLITAIPDENPADRLSLSIRSKFMLAHTSCLPKIFTSEPIVHLDWAGLTTFNPKKQWVTNVLIKKMTLCEENNTTFLAPEILELNTFIRVFSFRSYVLKRIYYSSFLFLLFRVKGPAGGMHGVQYDFQIHGSPAVAPTSTYI